MTKGNTVKVELTHTEAYVVMQALYDAQLGYSSGDEAPNRVIKLREVIAKLEHSVENAIDAAG